MNKLAYFTPLCSVGLRRNHDHMRKSFTKPSKVAGTGSLGDLSIHHWYCLPLPDGQLRSPVDIDV